MKRGSAATANAPEKPKQETADERDARLEARYAYDLRGERSTMAFVAVYAEELAQQFFEWREREYQLSRTTGEGIFDGLRRWEVARFGSQLDSGPHGILLFQVRIRLKPEHGGRLLPDGYFDRKPRAKRLPATPEVMVDKLSKEMRMPSGRMSKQQIEDRIRELDAQAAELRRESEGRGDGLKLDVDQG